MSDRPVASLWPLFAFEANSILNESRAAPKYVLSTASTFYTRVSVLFELIL